MTAEAVNMAANDDLLHCARCGYALVGIADDRCCPECALPVSVSRDRVRAALYAETRDLRPCIVLLFIAYLIGMVAIVSSVGLFPKPALAAAIGHVALVHAAGAILAASLLLRWRPNRLWRNAIPIIALVALSLPALAFGLRSLARVGPLELDPFVVAGIPIARVVALMLMLIWLTRRLIEPTLATTAALVITAGGHSAYLIAMLVMLGDRRILESQREPHVAILGVEWVATIVGTMLLVSAFRRTSVPLL